MPFVDLAAASHLPLSTLNTLKVGNLLFTSTVLPFNMQAQTQTNWCWAATSTSVSHFYFSASTWTQCKVAGAELQRSDCCNAPVPSPCNVPWYLDRALTRTSNFVRLSAPISYAEIETELKAGRVIGTRIGWNGGGGHFMCIYGCSRVGSTEFVDIDDPIYGKSHITLATFSNNYQGSGHWTTTYFTKRWPNLKIKLPLLSAQLIDAIGEIRPLFAVKQGVRELATAESRQVGLAVPHHVFVLGLNDILDEKPFPRQPVSTRVFEVEEGKSRAFYEVAPPEQGTAQLQSMSNDPATLDLLQKGLSEAQRIAEQGDVEPELQFVRVPALYVEAFVLRYPDEQRDVVVPVRGLGLFEPMRPISARDFQAKLREAARERSRGNQDDTIAP
jgi:hypothetical protein